MLNPAFLYSFQSNKETENQMFKIGLGRIGCLPLIIILFSFKRIVHEYREWNFSNVINAVILVFIIVVTLLYISNRLLGEKYWSKHKYPNLSVLGRIWFYFNPRPNCLNLVLYKLLCLLPVTNFPVYQELTHLYSTPDN